MEPLEKIFESHFGRKPAVLSRAPGRLEILGNHTDYNEGYVLSAAVTQATSFAMAPKEGSVCTLVDCALSGEFKIDLDNMDAPRSRVRWWSCAAAVSGSARSMRCSGAPFRCPRE